MDPANICVFLLCYLLRIYFYRSILTKQWHHCSPFITSILVLNKIYNLESLLACSSVVNPTVGQSIVGCRFPAIRHFFKEDIWYFRVYLRNYNSEI